MTYAQHPWRVEICWAASALCGQVETLSLGGSNNGLQLDDQFAYWGDGPAAQVHGRDAEVLMSVSVARLCFARKRQFRRAILRAGEACWLHPVEVHGNAHSQAVADMFARGHLDHIALGAGSRAAFDQLRARLLAQDRTDGTVEDLGAFQALWFIDPDGMRGELTLIVVPALSKFHAPRSLPSAVVKAAHSASQRRPGRQLRRAVSVRARSECLQASRRCVGSAR